MAAEYRLYRKILIFHNVTVFNADFLCMPLFALSLYKHYYCIFNAMYGLINNCNHSYNTDLFIEYTNSLETHLDLTMNL